MTRQMKDAKRPVASFDHVALIEDSRQRRRFDMEGMLTPILVGQMSEPVRHLTKMPSQRVFISHVRKEGGLGTMAKPGLKLVQRTDIVDMDVCCDSHDRLAWQQVQDRPQRGEAHAAVDN